MYSFTKLYPAAMLFASVVATGVFKTLAFFTLKSFTRAFFIEAICLTSNTLAATFFLICSALSEVKLLKATI